MRTAMNFDVRITDLHLFSDERIYTNRFVLAIILKWFGILMYDFHIRQEQNFIFSEIQHFPSQERYFIDC